MKQFAMYIIQKNNSKRCIAEAENLPSFMLEMALAYEEALNDDDNTEVRFYQVETGEEE